MSEREPAARPRIDWTAIHRRLENAATLFERGHLLTAEQRTQVLKARAEALAATREPEDTQHELPIVEFLLGHERYAIEAAFVREVYPLKELTPLPGVPPFVRGIVNVRGQIISVVDPKDFFDIPRQGLTELNKVLILSDQSFEFGLLADAIVGMYSIAADHIQPPLPTFTGIRAEYLHGVTARHLVVLNAARILADPTIVVREISPGQTAMKETP